MSRVGVYVLDRYVCPTVGIYVQGRCVCPRRYQYEMLVYMLDSSISNEIYKFEVEIHCVNMHGEGMMRYDCIRPHQIK